MRRRRAAGLCIPSRSKGPLGIKLASSGDRSGKKSREHRIVFAAFPRVFAGSAPGLFAGPARFRERLPAAGPRRPWRALGATSLKHAPEPWREATRVDDSERKACLHRPLRRADYASGVIRRYLFGRLLRRPIPTADSRERLIAQHGKGLFRYGLLDQLVHLDDRHQHRHHDGQHHPPMTTIISGSSNAVMPMARRSMSRDRSAPRGRASAAAHRSSRRWRSGG